MREQTRNPQRRRKKLLLLRTKERRSFSIRRRRPGSKDGGSLRGHREANLAERVNPRFASSHSSALRKKRLSSQEEMSERYASSGSSETVWSRHVVPVRRHRTSEIGIVLVQAPPVCKHARRGGSAPAAIRFARPSVVQESDGIFAARGAPNRISIEAGMRE